MGNDPDQADKLEDERRQLRKAIETADKLMRDVHDKFQALTRHERANTVRGQNLNASFRTYQEEIRTLQMRLNEL